MAGEGYPFDYNQNSAVWAGTPLFVSHTSRDGRYVAADSPYTCGWIDVRDIAFVSDDFVAAYRAGTLGAILRDRIPLESDQGGFLFEGRVGMLLPFERAAGPETSVLAALADEDRHAVLTRARAPSDVIAAAPLAFSGGTSRASSTKSSDSRTDGEGWAAIGTVLPRFWTCCSRSACPYRAIRDSRPEQARSWISKRGCRPLRSRIAS